MKFDLQNLIAIVIASLAAVWAGWMFLSPIIAAMRPKKEGDCGGSCGCGKAPKTDSHK
jgi:hypothetical protein